MKRLALVRELRKAQQSDNLDEVERLQSLLDEVDDDKTKHGHPTTASKELNEDENDS